MSAKNETYKYEGHDWVAGMGAMHPVGKDKVAITGVIRWTGTDKQAYAILVLSLRGGFELLDTKIMLPSSRKEGPTLLSSDDEDYAKVLKECGVEEPLFDYQYRYYGVMDGDKHTADENGWRSL